MKFLFDNIFGATNVHRYNILVIHYTLIRDQKAKLFGLYAKYIGLSIFVDPQFVISIGIYILIIII
jgi:hypothetical protein